MPYQILNTVIHEARHRCQYSNLDKENLPQKEYLVAKSLLKPEHTDYSDYLSSLDEIDARNCSLQYFRNVAKETKNSETLAQFYNLKKKEEFNLNKNPVSSTIQNYFPDVYNTNFLETNENLINKDKFRKFLYNQLDSSELNK